MALIRVNDAVEVKIRYSMLGRHLPLQSGALQREVSVSRLHFMKVLLGEQQSKFF